MDTGHFFTDFDMDYYGIAAPTCIIDVSTRPQCIGFILRCGEAGVNQFRIDPCGLTNSRWINPLIVTWASRPISTVADVR
jgi:hypothetical protein